MTRAEKASIAYQLVAHGPRVMGGGAILSEDDYKFWNINYDFKAGYEQAEKDLADVAQFSSGPDGFFYGKWYQQAKKDFELTWEDIIELEDLMAMVHYEFRNGIGKESFGKEVLEKFKAMKEEKK